MTRRFGGLVAVNNVSFAVRSGEIFGLIGPNGAGKTTLFNLMTGLTAPSAGSLVYQGTNITGAKPYQIARRGIAHLSEYPPLWQPLRHRECDDRATCTHESGRLGGHLWPAARPA